MADTKLSALTAITGANIDPAADYILVYDASATTDKKTLVSEFAKADASSPKAWVEFTTSGVISAGYNVASVTKNGAGDYTVNFTVPFSSATYAWICTAQDVTPVIVVGVEPTSASACRIKSRTVADVLADSSGSYSAVFFGDQ